MCFVHTEHRAPIYLVGVMVLVAVSGLLARSVGVAVSVVVFVGRRVGVALGAVVLVGVLVSAGFDVGV